MFLTALLPTMNSWEESKNSLLIPDHSHQTYSTTDTQKAIKVLNIHNRSGMIVNGSSSDYNGKIETGQLRGLQGV